MNASQPDLFETGNSLRNCRETINIPGSDQHTTRPSDTNKSTISDIDHHMIGIISEYIKKLPDNDTKKHIARIMINFIMKSADL